MLKDEHYDRYQTTCGYCTYSQHRQLRRENKERTLCLAVVHGTSSTQDGSLVAHRHRSDQADKESSHLADGAKDEDVGDEYLCSVQHGCRGVETSDSSTVA